MRAKENCGSYSNVSTKRSGNVSRESTCRGIIGASIQSSCFSSPKNVVSQSYSRIHLIDKNQQETRREHQVYQHDIQAMIKSSIKIQRFWRFHLLMRRKAQDLVIKNLKHDYKIQQHTLKNVKTYNQILTQTISSLSKQSITQSSLHLLPIKQSMKLFTQSSIKKQMLLMSVISRIRKEIHHYNTSSNSIKQSILEHEQSINQLLQKQRFFKQRQEAHFSKMNRLNKDLILLNMEKSRMQLEVDQLRCEIKEDVNKKDD